MFSMTSVSSARRPRPAAPDYDEADATTSIGLRWQAGFALVRGDPDEAARLERLADELEWEADLRAAQEWQPDVHLPDVHLRRQP